MSASRKARLLATPRVRSEWHRRIEAEYRSAALTQELGHFLLILGAPESLVRDAVRITTDELAHARLSAAVARAAGERRSPTLAQESLVNARVQGEPLFATTTRVVVAGYCLGETIAVRLFAAMRAKCDIPVARRALDRILRDEVRHRDFGWNSLEWLLEAGQPGDVEAQIRLELPAMLEAQRDAYAPPSLVAEQSLPEEERRWGLLPGASYAAIVAAAPARDYAPRFARLGISPE